MQDEKLRRLRSFRDALDSQDAILRDGMKLRPRAGVSVQQALPIKRLFESILQQFPESIQKFDYHGDPSALRAQISGARSLLQNMVDDLESEQVEKTSGIYLREHASSNLSNAQLAGKIFIGHGRSHLWRALKDFIENDLHLSTEEFNREAAAGKVTVERLGEMLDRTALALIVMTAEDLQPDGSMRARENVVHEAGLFQGRLGFKRSIILLEKGCSTFSNIHGLTVIEFQKDEIAGTFEEIRRTLRREGIIPAIAQ